MSSDHLLDLAADWVARQDRGWRTNEEREFETWLAEDPRHRTAFAHVAHAWEAGNRAGQSLELRKMAQKLAGPARPALHRGWLAAAALAAASIIAGTFLFESTRGSQAASPTDYRVVSPDENTLTLSDGSVVDIRGGGRISTDFTPGLRHVILEAGEAHFAVAKNSARPFVVSLGALSVRVVGTVFNLRRSPAQLEVLVTEGKVRLQDPAGVDLTGVGLLEKGDRVTVLVKNDGRLGPLAIDHPACAQIDSELAWRSTWLVFDRTPLDEAVAAFNQRNPQRQIFADPGLAARRLGGTFRADNVAGFIRLLSSSPDIRAEQEPDGATRLLPREEAHPR